MRATARRGSAVDGRAPACYWACHRMADDKVQGLSYRDAGVDIDAGNEAVQRIRSLVASTRRPEQVSDLGGFAGMMGLPSGLRDPLLVS